MVKRGALQAKTAPQVPGQAMSEITWQIQRQSHFMSHHNNLCKQPLGMTGYPECGIVGPFLSLKDVG